MGRCFPPTSFFNAKMYKEKFVHLILHACCISLNNIRNRRLVASTRGAPQFNVSCANATLPPSNRPRRPTRNRLRSIPNLNCNVFYLYLTSYLSYPDFSLYFFLSILPGSRYTTRKISSITCSELFIQLLTSFKITCLSS